MLYRGAYPTQMTFILTVVSSSNLAVLQVYMSFCVTPVYPHQSPDEPARQAGRRLITCHFPISHKSFVEEEEEEDIYFCPRTTMTMPKKLNASGRVFQVTSPPNVVASDSASQKCSLGCEVVVGNQKGG